MTASYAPTGDNPAKQAGWDVMLDEFRALGGVAENVVLETGAAGQGLFVGDPAKPFRLGVPENLLIRSGDTEFADDAIRVRNDASVAPAERDFFERYQANFSWGGGGGIEAAELISMLDMLPPELRAMLGGNFAMQDALEGERGARIRRQFLRRRLIGWRRDNFFVPALELANFSSEGVPLTFDEQGGMRIEGEAEGEILVSMGPQDALGTFRKFGIASQRPHAFSLPMETKINRSRLVISRNVAAKTERAGFSIPQMKSDPGEVHLSYLMVGNANYPRASRGIFDTLMREAAVPGAAEAFDLILHFNRAEFLHLLEALEPLQGEMPARLRRMAHLQLGALAHCVGTREF